MDGNTLCHGVPRGEQRMDLPTLGESERQRRRHCHQMPRWESLLDQPREDSWPPLPHATTVDTSKANLHETPAKRRKTHNEEEGAQAK